MTEPTLNDADIDWLSVVVARDDVGRSNISTHSKRSNPSSLMVRRFQGRLDIAFEGYHQDPSEIYEASDIRPFVAEISLTPAIQNT